jgi:Fe-S-cluster containining protein
MHMATPPYTADEESELKERAPHVYADLLAAERSRDLQWRVHQVDAIPCGFFDMVTSKCRHHEHKPGTCLDFDIGGEGCLAYRSSAGFEV